MHLPRSISQQLRQHAGSALGAMGFDRLEPVGPRNSASMASAITSGVEVANSMRRPAAVAVEAVGDVEVLLEWFLSGK